MGRSRSKSRTPKKHHKSKHRKKSKSKDRSDRRSASHTKHRERDKSRDRSSKSRLVYLAQFYCSLLILATFAENVLFPYRQIAVAMCLYMSPSTRRKQGVVRWMRLSGWPKWNARGVRRRLNRRYVSLAMFC